MSKNEQQEWSYKTQHMDIILWSYCCGLFSFVPWLDRERAVNIFDEDVTGKIAQMKNIYNLSPSFTVKLIMNKSGDGASFEMKKVMFES